MKSKKDIVGDMIRKCREHFGVETMFHGNCGTFAIALGKWAEKQGLGEVSLMATTLFYNEDKDKDLSISERTGTDINHVFCVIRMDGEDVAFDGEGEANDDYLDEWQRRTWFECGPGHDKEKWEVENGEVPIGVGFSFGGLDAKTISTVMQDTAWSEDENFFLSFIDPELEITMDKALDAHDLDAVKRLIKTDPEIAFKDVSSFTSPLSYAAGIGFLDGVKFLHEKRLSKGDNIEARKDATNALISASSDGHKEVVEYLIPFSDPKKSNSWPLIMALVDGHVEIVKLLLPHSDPMAADCMALADAAEKGHVECIKILLPGSDYETARHRLSLSKLNEAIALLDSVWQADVLKKKHVDENDTSIRKTPTL